MVPLLASGCSSGASEVATIDNGEAELSPDQSAAVADGVGSEAEYVAGVDRAIDCLEDLGWDARRIRNGRTFEIEANIGEGELTDAEFAVAGQLYNGCLKRELDRIEDLYLFGTTEP